MNTSAIDPLRTFGAAFATMAPASQRALESTWRQHAKACARHNVPAWPLNDVNIELSVRRWIACGVSGATLKLRQWAFKRWVELSGKRCDVQALSSETWARFLWSSPHRSRQIAPQLTVHETALLIDEMRCQCDLDWLRALVILTNHSGVPLRTWLAMRQRDVTEQGLTLRPGKRQFALPLDSEDRQALRPLLKRGGGEGYVFSADGGGAPLSPSIVNRHLRMTAHATLGHAVTMHMVQAAAVRFLLQLGIAAASLSQSTGLSRTTLVRLSGLQVEARDFCLVTRYGIPTTWRVPSFVQFYRAACTAKEPYTGARDRAILNLLFFNFATPDAVSAMEQEDFHGASYSVPREDDLVASLANEQVVGALDEWMNVRGSQPGPLFLVPSASSTPQRMSAEDIELMVRERTRDARHPFDAASLRWAGVSRAAHAGLPLAELADLANLSYFELADGLGLYQRAETVTQVTRQIEALRAARLSPDRYEALRRGQLRQCYIHEGSP